MTLIDNTGQSTEAKHSTTFEIATAFTTGSQSEGYRILSVDIRLRTVWGKTTVVAICQKSGSNPGNAVAHLTSPKPWKGAGLNTFTAPKNTVLQPNTTYFLVVNHRTAGLGRTNVKVEGTSSNDQTGATGWSIADNSREFTGKWSTVSYKLSFTITGTTDFPAVDLTVSGGGTVTEGEAALTLTATRSEPNTSGSALTIPLQVKTSGTTAQASDYTVAASISIPNNSATGTTTFSVTDDDLVEGTETVVIELGTLPVGTIAGDKNEVTLTLTDNDVPPKSTGFTATAGDRQVTLSWANPNISAITGYQYRQKKGSDGYDDWTLIPNGTAATTTYNVSGLTNGTAYTFQVRARAGRLDGAASEEASATPMLYLQTTLVGNTDTRRGSFTSPHEYGTSFTTGSNGSGYTISSVDIGLRNVSDRTTVVAIRKLNGLNPGSLVVTLTNPVTFKANALNTFTAPANTVLKPNTTYYLVVNDGRTGRTSKNVILSRTQEGSQAGISGWSIANISRFNLRGIWNPTVRLDRLRFAITGNLNPLTIDLTVSGGGTVTESDAPLTLTATRSETNTSGSALVIPIQVKTSGTTAQASDYTVAASISIPNNSATGTTTFSVTDDNRVEGTETVIIELGTLPADNVAGSNREVTLTLNDNDPTVTLAAGTSPVTEGTAASFTVTRNASQTTALTVSLRVSESTTEGQAFVASNNKGSKEVTILPNQTAAAYTVNTVGDSTDEPSGAVTVQIAAGTDYYVSGSNDSATVKVRDDDATEVVLTTPDTEAAEGSSDRASLVLTLGRALRAGERLQVPLTFSGGTVGTDFTLSLSGSPTGVALSGGTVTFSGSDGGSATMATVLLTASEDDDTTDETVIVSIPMSSMGTAPILTASGLDGGAEGSRTGSGQITLSDNDNTTPTVMTMILDQTATVGIAFRYTFPENTFNDADGDALTYTATQGNGSPLPGWLTFDADTRTFSGTPQTADEGILSVKVTADDSNDGSVSDNFDITVREKAPLGADDAAEAVIVPNPSGRYLEVRSSVGGTFQLLSLSGKPLLEGTTNTRVDITSLKSGLYLVQLPSGRLLKFVRE